MTAISVWEFLRTDNLGWLVDASLKGVLILAAAWLGTLTLRRASGAMRHLVWSVAMGAMLLLPLLEVGIPKWTLAILPATNEPPVEAAIPAASSPPPVTYSVPPATRVPVAPIERAQPSSSESAIASPQAASRPAPTAPIEARPTLTWSTIIMSIWLAGVAAMLAPILVGALAMRRLQRRSTRLVDGEIIDETAAVARELGLGFTPDVYLSAAVPLPMIWGLFRPRVMLPLESVHWPADRRRIVLLHELAHIRRLDCWTQHLAHVARAFYWFNPLVWPAVRQMRIERERACDDYVLNLGARPSNYAELLLQLAQTRMRFSPRTLASLSMAHPSQIENRILAILNPGQSRRTPSRRMLAGIASAALFLLLPLAAIQAIPQKSPVQTDAKIASSSEIKEIAAAPEPIEQAAPAAAAVEPVATPPAEVIPPKVGIIFSALTCESPLPDVTEFGETLTNWSSLWQDYFFQNVMVPGLRSLGFEVYAIVEPETSGKGKLVEMLTKHKLTDSVIDGTDVEALKRLDVIGTVMSISMREDVVEAIKKAVHEGVGFVNIGFFGSIRPGNTASLKEFLGIDQSPANLRFYEQNMNLDFVGPEELHVGYFATNKDLFKMSAVVGFTGVVDGTPLLALPPGVDDNFAPAYIREYGKGRMLSISMFVGANPAAMNMLAMRTMGQYAINWTAGEKLDTNWRAAMQAAAKVKSIAAAPKPATDQIGDVPAKPAAIGPPSVGLILGEVSKAPPHYQHPGRGTYFDNVMNLIVVLETLGYETYGVVDPAAARDPRLVEMIDGANLNGRIIEATSAEELGKVDILLSFFVPNLSESFLVNIQAAVEKGIAFLSAGEIGSDTPEGREQLAKVIGLDPDPAKLTMRMGEHKGRIVQHPDFVGSPHKVNDRVGFWNLVGYEGKPDGNPILAEENAESNFVPGYTRRLGQGRVAVLQCWKAYPADGGPLSLIGTEDVSLMNESMNWLAGRPLDSVWNAAMKR